MSITKRVLLKFGLSENEIAVYLEAIKHEETNPFALAKATGIPRTTIYEVITSLSLKGLIELTKSDGITKQQTRIKAKNPSTLRHIIKNKKNELTNLDSEIVHILPTLKMDFLKHESNSDFQYYPGIEGAKEVFASSKLDDVDLPCYLFNYKIPDDVFGRDFINQMIDESYKIKRTNTPKEIIPLTDWTRHCIGFHFERNPQYLNVTETRYVEDATFAIRTLMMVKADRIWVVSVEDDECYGMILKSRTLASSLIGIFQMLWLVAKPLNAALVRRWIKN